MGVHVLTHCNPNPGKMRRNNLCNQITYGSSLTGRVASRLYFSAEQ